MQPSSKGCHFQPYSPWGNNLTLVLIVLPILPTHSPPIPNNQVLVMPPT
jgi:hypothetical protein